MHDCLPSLICMLIFVGIACVAYAAYMSPDEWDDFID